MFMEFAFYLGENRESQLISDISIFFHLVENKIMEC